jgi:hypothetical protein
MPNPNPLKSQRKEHKGGSEKSPPIFSREDKNMKGNYLIYTDRTNDNELHYGNVASATQRAISKLRECVMAKWVEVKYIRPAEANWHGEVEHEFVARIPQEDN